MSRDYEKRVLKRRPASLTSEEWDNLLVRRISWPPPGQEQLPPPDLSPLDRVVLCWWCRTNHLASEVETCMALPTKRSIAKSGSSTSSVSAGKLLSGYPELWALLTCSMLPDGSSRRTGRLSLSCDGGRLRLSLIDDETAQYATLDGSTLEDLLAMADSGMADGSLDWRASKFNGKSAKR